MDVGGAVAGASSAAQRQLLDALLHGCKQAVNNAGLDSKVLSFGQILLFLVLRTRKQCSLVSF